MKLAFSLFVAMFLAVPALAEASTPIEFTTPTQFALKAGDHYVLPAGQYTMYQFTQDDSNLFALYKGHDHTGEPVAIIDASQVPYEQPELVAPEAEVQLKTTEPESAAMNKPPVLTGWSVGNNEWRVRDITVRQLHDFTTLAY